MQLDIYEQETRLLTEKNSALLDEVRMRLKQGKSLSNLEQAGTLHALQVLIENAIGKAKHTLKHFNRSVPISAYDVFESLVEINVVSTEELIQWNAIIGLRNKIVHDYMNIEPGKVFALIESRKYDLVASFLLAPVSHQKMT